MWEVLDVLKRHHRGESQRRIAVATGRGRKTIRAYIREAKKLGWSKEVPPDDELASRVAQRCQPGPSSSEASASEKALRAHHDRIQQWVEGPEGERGLKLTKVHELLTREGVDVSYSSVYRYAVEQFGLARSRLTLRRAEVSPGELAEVDFGQLGKISTRSRIGSDSSGRCSSLSASAATSTFTSTSLRSRTLSSMDWKRRGSFSEVCLSGSSSTT